jgi:hypothetical protein
MRAVIPPPQPHAGSSFITPDNPVLAWRTQLAKLFEYVINKIVMNHAKNIPFRQ